MSRFILALGIACAADWQPANADFLEYRFSGEVVRGERAFLLSDEVMVGTPVEGAFSFDLESPPIGLGDELEGYLSAPSTLLEVTIGGDKYAASGQFAAFVRSFPVGTDARNFSFVLADGVSLDPGGEPGPSLTGDEVLLNGVPQVGSFAIGFDELGTEDLPPSTALPTELDLSRFFEASGAITVDFVNQLGGIDRAELIFSIDSISAVPEPSTALLLALGLAAFPLHCRKSKV